MNYLQFHLLFLIPPILLVAGLPQRANTGAERGGIRALLLVIVIALAYTTPWDDYLVWRGVWRYGSERVIGTIGYVPVEEYLFFCLQPILVGLCLLWLAPRAFAEDQHLPPHGRLWMTGISAALALAGALALLLGSARWVYLGLILIWSAPVVAGMCWMGAEVIWKRRRAAWWGVAVPSLYLWFADWAAIRSGIWAISDEYSLGLDPLGLPIEEPLFFLATNVLVVSWASPLLAGSKWFDGKLMPGDEHRPLLR